jgi:peroxiredoxin
MKTMLARSLLAVALLGASLTASAVVPDDASNVDPLPVGATMPTVTVRDPDGSDRVLGPQALTRPAILIFYRGGWCPYCNAHLGALKGVEPALLELGYALVFLSADRPELLNSSLQESDLGFTLLSDARMQAARAFGVAFRVDDATAAKYREHGIDLDETSGESHHELPVPAVFIVDRQGVIRYVFANADYKVRIDPQQLLAEARRLR